MKNTITRDYHGVLLEDVLRDLDRLLWCECDAYQDNEVTIIVGHGATKEAVIKYISQFERIEWWIPISNMGEIKINL